MSTKYTVSNRKIYFMHLFSLKSNIFKETYLFFFNLLNLNEFLDSSNNLMNTSKIAFKYLENNKFFKDLYLSANRLKMMFKLLIIITSRFI